MTKRDYPDYVSFTDAAALIVRHGLASSMTPRGLRYMATARSSKTTPEEEAWPFGNGPHQEPYLIAGRTRMMRTERLLEYLERHPPTGRGPALKPRASGPES
ncbi:hypothetical protein HZZ00_38010 (plasmid) [Streptomyces sp. NEAU-sy36]|uniref:hypothetical protein n=1 Tax=unclassified Streptomyces TaxID=2593676 RepID=UPI0015D5FBAF|nr:MULTISPECIES: hypothetical protein [unclassified Streptomyces]QLJ06827.1 hypothetical protein HZZ00_38010 [Streptomyces sp. NEAU-sy36]